MSDRMAQAPSKTGWFVTVACAGFTFGVVFTIGVFTL